jgi:hypothetical protein
MEERDNHTAEEEAGAGGARSGAAAGGPRPGVPRRSELRNKKTAIR